MVKGFYKISMILILVLVILALGTTDLVAQCPMCKMAAESNLREGGTDGKGLNAGILFILSLPYVIVGSIGYVWWKNNRDLDGPISSFRKPPSPGV